MDAGVNEIDLSRRSAFDELGIITLWGDVAIFGKVVEDRLKLLGCLETTAETHYVTASKLGKTIFDYGGQYIFAG